MVDLAEADDHETTPTGPLRTLGHVLWLLLLVLLPVFLLTSMALGVGYVRLHHGPVSLKFLADPISRGLGAELSDIEIKVADVELRLAADSAIEFRLKGVRVLEKDGDLVASAPEAAALISTDALWSGRLVPSRLDLLEPRLNLLYSEESGFSLSFSVPDAAATPTDPQAATQGGGAAGGPSSAGQPISGPGELPGLKRIDLARVVAESSRRARRGIDATSYLREIGLRNASILVDNGGKRSLWRVPEATVDLEHNKRSSVIAGAVKLASQQGPWTVAFRAEESERTKMLVVKATVRDLVPKALDSTALPGLAGLMAIDAPVSSDATIEMSSDGSLRSAEADIEIGAGRLGATVAGGKGLGIEGALLHLAYDAATRRIELKPSPVRWEGGRATIQGGMTGMLTEDGRPGWDVSGETIDAVLLADDIGRAPLPVTSARATAQWLPAEGVLRISAADVRVGGAEIGLVGEIDAGAGTSGMRLEGRMGPMNLATFTTVWPKAVAPLSREWVARHVTGGTVKGGTLHVASGRHLREEAPAAATATGDRFTLAFEAADIVGRPLDRMAPVEAPRVLVRIEGRALEITAPDAAVALPSGRRVPLKGGRFAVADLAQRIPQAEIHFKSTGPLGPALELMEQEPLALVQRAGSGLEGVDGKTEGQFVISLPLAERVALSDLKLEGKARVFDVKAKNIVPGFDVQGATVHFDIGSEAVDARGEMLIAGVTSKLTWQHIIGAPVDKQPPMRLSAALDDADRTQLGLDINHLVSGEVPVDITVTRGARDEPAAVRVRSDLTNAELALDGLAWRKAPGRAAWLQFDVVRLKAPQPRVELQNLKITGDDVAMEGTAVLGPDNRLREFRFPAFNLNVVTRLDVSGRVGTDNVWNVKARGTTFDGRDFFRSLFTVGPAREKAARPAKPRAGVDIEADIDTVLGFSDASLKGLRLKMSTRGERMVSLTSQGVLDSGHPLAAVVSPGEAGAARRLLVDTTNAGLAFKLVDIYPNVQGGRARLEVNLDGKGPAEKTGILWVDNFAILGDPVIAEVVSSAGTDPIDASGARVRQRVVRQSFDFDRMKAPFSVGHGQLVLEDIFLRGPLLGATVRGKVDYRTKSVSLGGTYVPLQGLNNVLGDVPLLGQILSGPRGEGIFGITFAIQGPMAAPQVIVNPLSMVAPGIFREMFQMTAPDPRVQVREERKQAEPADARTRASSVPAAVPRTAAPVKGAAGPSKPALDGWSSETKDTTAKDSLSKDSQSKDRPAAGEQKRR